MNRKLLNNIQIVNGEVVSKGSDGRYAHLFQKQGTMDGACATYSVMMSLLILGTISEEDIGVDGEYTSRASKKLFKIFCENHGMHRDGQTFYKINKMLKEGFASEIISKHRLTHGKDSMFEIVNNIDNGTPVVASVVFQDGGSHAITIVGYEDEGGTIHKLLCLDPSGEEPKGRKRWNGELTVYRKRKFFDFYVSYGNLKVELTDILIIKRR